MPRSPRHTPDFTPAGRAAHFRRQQDDSLALLAGMQAEREAGAALAPLPATPPDTLLAEVARIVGEGR